MPLILVIFAILTALAGTAAGFLISDHHSVAAYRFLFIYFSLSAISVILIYRHASSSSTLPAINKESEPHVENPQNCAKQLFAYSPLATIYLKKI